ncbi:vWA domain-containing protein [Gilvimarinus sp. F26214L]|uniref:vWA domain-containing protein n=1 Tax=Gilvimarinus sp. DZF01 TaxID=3461371 RepID=UPI00404627FF
MLQFEWPLVFLLLPLPLLVYWGLPRARRDEAALRVPFYQALSTLPSGRRRERVRGKGLTALLSLMWLSLVVAAAGPQWLGEPVRLPASGRDLLLAVDISGSMETADMVLNGQQVNRISVIKAVVGDFVRRRESDRLGLILFGTRAYLQAPLTFDRNTVNTLLQEARLGFAGEKTAIGDAIGLATKRLLDRPEGKRVLILLTDGANTAGAVDPLQAADLASQAGVKIYTVGIGAEELVVPGIFGSNFGARRVNPSADLDEKTLVSIADKTGGRYFRARDVQELAGIYAELDILEPAEQEAESFRPTQALFYWPLGAALLLSALIALSRLRLPALAREVGSTRPDASVENT